jgi:hypothetical protein
MINGAPQPAITIRKRRLAFGDDAYEPSYTSYGKMVRIRL